MARMSLVPRWGARSSRSWHNWKLLLAVKTPLHSCTTCWSNWWKCPAHKCVTSHAGFLTHFLNSHNPSPADQFLIWSNGLQTGQEFKIGLQHVHIKLEIACQSWDFARQSTMARLYACTMYTFVLELLNGCLYSVDWTRDWTVGLDCGTGLREKVALIRLRSSTHTTTLQYTYITST